MKDSYVLQTHRLTKKYKKQYAVDHVDLSIEKGAIYAFIGKNGAGKSTLIRLAAGLAFPTSGAIELFGASGESGLTEARKRIGTMIEGPALYPHMTAAENLEVHRLLKGIPGKGSISKTLALVGLQDTGKKKAKNFSLGMKQRLGLAIALLGEPEFLILDEPTNGLDPMGVMDTRELLKKLNREYGITIFISSHILSELHLLATHYGIIHQGKLLEQLSLGELQEKCRQYLHIKVDNPEKAAAILETSIGTEDYEVMPDGAIQLFAHMDDPSSIATRLVSEGLKIEQFTEKGESLESYFTNLVRGGRHG